MVQFLLIIFFSWISSIFVGIFKSSRFFCVTLYVYIYKSIKKRSGIKIFQKIWKRIIIIIWKTMGNECNRTCSMAGVFLQFTGRCNICRLRKIWITSSSRGKGFCLTKFSCSRRRRNFLTHRILSRKGFVLLNLFQKKQNDFHNIFLSVRIKPFLL